MKKSELKEIILEVKKEMSEVTNFEDDIFFI